MGWLVACRILVSALVPFQGLRILDFKLGLGFNMILSFNLIYDACMILQEKMTRNEVLFTITYEFSSVKLMPVEWEETQCNQNLLQNKIESQAHSVPWSRI